MQLNGKILLTQKELSHRWGLCLRAVQNNRKRWKMRPATFIGLMPLFDESEVQRVEHVRLCTRQAQLAGC